MPASTNSSVRSRIRQSEQQSLGLEDELDFGSDEDLMETIGEIDVHDEDAQVPDLPPLAPTESTSSSRRRPKSSRSSRSLNKKEEKRSRNSSASSLASSTHLLPPLPPVPSGSSLDLPSEMFGTPDSRKRGSILGAFKVKGLRKWRDDQSSRASMFSDSQSAASTVSLSKIVSNTSSRPSFTASATASSISAAPHLGPLPSFDSVSVSDQRAAAQKAMPGANYEQVVPKLSPRDDSLRRADADARAAGAQRTSWSPGDISNAILPSFPATLASLEPIAVLVAQAAKRPPSSAMAGRGNSLPYSGRWVPCTLVFTLFKISTGDESAHDERTVAHVHVFTQKQSGGPTAMNSPVRRSKSNAGIGGLDANVPRVETERRYLTRQSSALVSDEDTDADGRMVVLRLLFGAEDRSKGNEWVLEMKDANRLREWVRQIKKTAIMINAEELGYGQAIRSAFESSSVSADDLAHKLSVHARSVAEQRENTAPPTPVRKDIATSQTASQPDVRSSSAEVAQTAALSRSRSAEEPPLPSVGMGNSTSSHEAGEHANGDFDGIDSLSLGKLNLGPNLSFPAPPSALPSRQVRAPAPPTAQPVSPNPQAVNRATPPMSYTPPPPAASSPQLAQPASYATSQGSTPVMRGPPNLPPSAASDMPHPNGSAHPQLNGSSASLPNGGTSSPPTNGRPSFSPMQASTPSFSAPATPATPGMNSPQVPDAEVLDDEGPVHVRPPTPPRRSSTKEDVRPSPAVSMLQNGHGHGHAHSHGATPSIASTTNSGTSVTSRLRKLRGKPQVIDIMAEFSSIEAESMPPAEDEEPIRDDRERRIRFAEG